MGAPSMPTPPRPVRQAEYDAAMAKAQGGLSNYTGGLGAAVKQGMIDEVNRTMIVAPPPPPDLSDQLVRQRALTARRRLLLGGGLLGPLDLGAAPRSPGLLGQ